MISCIKLGGKGHCLFYLRNLPKKNVVKHKKPLPSAKVKNV
jgi:hypothetical protein